MTTIGIIIIIINVIVLLLFTILYIRDYRQTKQYQQECMSLMNEYIAKLDELNMKAYDKI